MKALIVTALIAIMALCLLGAASLLVILCNDELKKEIEQSKIERDGNN